VARAVAVANYLVQDGVDTNRLIVSGRGSAEPIFTDAAPEHQRLNGRVDIVIIYQVEESVVGLGSTGISQ
jgi:flagellar motor protein MotB